MADFVYYVGRADALTSKQKTERMNAICSQAESNGLRLIAAVPDMGTDGATAGVWLFFSPGSQAPPSADQLTSPATDAGKPQLSLT